MEERAFHCVAKRILHVNEVLDNLESRWVTTFISLTVCQRSWNYYLTGFDVACVTWSFDIFGSFKMKAQTFQFVYKGLRLIIESLKHYLMIKKRDFLDDKQDRFLRQFCSYSVMENCIERVSTNLACFEIILASV